MPGIFHEQMWQFVIATVIAVLAIVVSILIYLKQRQRKALSYQILTQTPLLGLEEKIKGKLQILFDGKPVEDVNLIEFRIINSGNMPILATDYEHPINLSFDEKTKVLTAEVFKTNPKSLKATVKIEDAKIILPPVLLNSRDSIILKTLVSQFNGKISVDGRIIGVKDIRKTKEAQYFTYTVLIGLFLAIVGNSLWTKRLFSIIPSEKLILTQDWPYLTLIIFGFFLILLGVCRTLRFAKSLSIY